MKERKKKSVSSQQKEKCHRASGNWEGTKEEETAKMGLRGKAESRMPGHCIIQPVEIVEKIQQNTNIGQCSSKHILRNHLYKTTQE